MNALTPEVVALADRYESGDALTLAEVQVLCGAAALILADSIDVKDAIL